MALPMLGLLVVATFGPGWLLLLAAGVRSWLARPACAPPLTFLLMGMGGLIFHALGVRWHGPTVGVYVLVCTLAVSAVRWTWMRCTGRHPSLRTWLAPALDAQGCPERCSGVGAPGEPETSSLRVILGAPKLAWAGIAVTWIVMILPILPGSGPDVPIQSADSIYHYNQAWLIEHTGNASMLDGNAGMFGMDSKYSFYPMVWHEIVTIAAVGWNQVVPATNTMLFVVPLVWLVGMAYLTRVILPEIPGAVYLALGAGALTPIFPVRLLMDTAVWPYCLALAACPAIVAWMVSGWRRAVWLWVQNRRRRAVSVFLGPMAALLGVVLAHPSACVIIGWPLAVVAWTGVLLAGVRHLRAGDPASRRHGMALLTVAGLVALAVIIFVLGPGPQQEHFGRHPDRNWSSPIIKLAIPVLLFYGGGGWIMKGFYIIMALLCFVGAGVSYTRHRHRGVVVAWAACLPLILAATAPVPVLSSLTGIFYNNPHRIKAMAAVPAILLIVIALAALRPLMGRLWRRYMPSSTHGWLRSGPVAASAVVLVAGTLASTPAVRVDVAGAFSPGPGHMRMVASPPELDMIRRLSQELPPGAYVVGDPTAGTAMLPFMAGQRSVWMFAGQSDSDADGYYLRYHFRDIHRDPKVCEIVRKHGITHFYRDVSQPFNGVPTRSLRPGFYGVRVSSGFTLVDRGGQAAVYSIDMCYDD